MINECYFCHSIATNFTKKEGIHKCLYRCIQGASPAVAIYVHKLAKHMKQQHTIMHNYNIANYVK